MAKTASASLDLRLRNDLPELRRLALAVEGFFARYDLPSDEGARMVLALDELVTNVMHHGGSAAQPVAEIEVSLDLAGDRVVAVIRDAGRPFNPLTMPEPDIGAPLEARPIGGLGIHLARQLMDVIRYRRDGDRNCLTLVKVLPGAPPAAPFLAYQLGPAVAP